MVVIDETSGPGFPLGNGNEVANQVLFEIWQALGHQDSRVPVLDEVLQEIRSWQRRAREAEALAYGDNSDESAEERAQGQNVRVVADKTVSWGAFGMTVIGYEADDVLKIRRAYKQELTQ